MVFDLETRQSDSPLVDRVWRARSVHSGMFQSMASNRLMMVVTLRDGKSMITVCGPATRATPLFCDADGEWVGIDFRVGAFMPHLPARALVDRDLTLPGIGERSFSLNVTAWHFPDYENADTFVDWLMRKSLLCREPVVGAVLQDQKVDISARSVQRHFGTLSAATVRPRDRPLAASHSADRPGPDSHGAAAGRRVDSRYRA